jgi:hypothetical protein
VQQFVAKHAENVIGTLSGFDRLVFRGTMRALFSRSGLMSYLWAVQVRLTEFAPHALKLTARLKDAPFTSACGIPRNPTTPHGCGRCCNCRRHPSLAHHSSLSSPHAGTLTRSQCRRSSHGDPRHQRSRPPNLAPDDVADRLESASGS